MQRELSLRGVVEERVVERARPLGVELVDADHQPDPVLARDRPEPVRVRARELERLAVQERERLLGARRTPAGQGFRPHRARVGRDERLREDDEVRSAGHRLRGPFGDAGEGARTIEDRRLDLDARRRDGLAHQAQSGGV
jgi:hypothetical protein